MSTPSEVFARLRAIGAELSRLDDDEMRRELEIEREQLRASARAAMVGEHDEGGLVKELDRLRKRLDELDAERIDVPGWQQRSRLRLSDPSAPTSQINRMIDEANAPEIVSIERRITEIEETLAPRDGTP